MDLKTKIGNLGGSNSVLKYSYTKILNNNQNIICTNRGIGATNSIYSLIQNLKFDLIAESDLLIFEYFVNDCNHDVQNINDSERIHKTIIELLKICQEKNTKILFLLIYNINHFKKGVYQTLASYHKYFELIKKYGIPYIDSNELLSPYCDDNLDIFYKGDTHLNELGMQILSEEIIKKIKTDDLHLACNISEEGYNGLCLSEISLHLSKMAQNFTNSLVSLSYIEVKKYSLCIVFDKKTTILAIEYLCDSNSGFVEIKNSHEIIQKNTLKNEKIVLDQGKPIAAIVTFNTKKFSLSEKFTIRIIDSSDISEHYFDKEKISHIPENSSTSFKIVSVLSTNSAKIRTCYLSEV